MAIEPQPQAAPPPQRLFQFRVTDLLLVTAVLGVSLAALVPAYRAAQQAGHQHSCTDNLKRIAMALQIYHDQYGRFPSAYQVDSAGKPAHSWRFVLWPFLESCGPYYFEYDFNEPWNGPSNSRLKWKNNNRLFACPSSGDRPGMTNYVAIVGKGTMWPGSKSADLADLKDGPSATIMIVEIAHSDIHWMEPRDLPIEELAEWLQPGHKPQLLGNHIEGGLVAYADGSVEMLPRSVTIERLGDGHRGGRRLSAAHSKP